MPQEFLFSCTSCDQGFPVTVKQAGMSCGCPFCGHANNLPGLRQIRLLPIQGDLSGNPVRPRNETNSLLFSGGLLVSVIAAVLGTTLVVYAGTLATESTVDEQIEFSQEQTDNLTPAQLWEVWDKMTANGLPDWQETPTVRYNKQSDYLRYIAYGLFTIAAIGLLALLMSFFVKSR